MMHLTREIKMKIENQKSKMGLRAIVYSLSSIFFLAPGCVKETKPVAAVNKSPLIVDEAMQQRNWPRSVVRFQNGETPAVATGFVLQHPKDAPKWAPVLTDGPLFLANVFVMPIGYVFTPPWTRVIYPAGVAEPSFTGVPPTR
jgi:hypothetical protein